MLYVTTRNNRDAYTAQRAMKENRSPDGGFWVPMRMSAFSPEEIAGLKDKTFGQCVAEVLNRLFSANLSGWDVEFCIGRNPVRLEPLGHRILMGECWHNTDGAYDRMVRDLTLLLAPEGEAPGSWLRVGVRAAMLFGLFGQLQRMGIDRADISVLSGDFSGPISAWYAGAWGLPIENIICCCNENNQLWSLICQGHFRTGELSIDTNLPEADVSLPEDLERLIYECGGSREVEKYLAVCRRGGLYTPDDALLDKLRRGIYVSVVSSRRSMTTIPSVYQTHDYLLTPAAALAYAGAMDYRAKTGTTRYTVVLSDKSPLREAAAVAAALGIPETELKKKL